MFKRHHHQLIEQVLMRLNSEFLLKSECYFGGGTAIVLKNNEYRESVDIDFLCASKEGYRLLVNTVESNSLGEIFQNPVSLLRDVRRDQNAIRTFLTIANVPIKIEFVREARIPLSGAIDPNLHVPTLCLEDMYAEKLLANADRGIDRAVNNRVLIDLAMLIRNNGPIPTISKDKTFNAYGDSVARYFHASVRMLEDDSYRNKCLTQMKMDVNLSTELIGILRKASATFFMTPWEEIEFRKRIDQFQNLKNRAGVEYIFYCIAEPEFKNNSLNVNWPEVEIECVTRALQVHNQPLDQAISKLELISPGCVLEQRRVRLKEIALKVHDEFKLGSHDLELKGRIESKPRIQ